MRSAFTLAALLIGSSLAHASSPYWGGLVGRDGPGIRRVKVAYQGDQVRSCRHIVGAVPMAFGVWVLYQGECYFTHNPESSECVGARVEFRDTNPVRGECLEGVVSPESHTPGIKVYEANDDTGRFYRHSRATLSSLSEIRELLDRLPRAGSRPLGNMEIEFLLDERAGVILDVYRAN